MTNIFQSPNLLRINGSFSMAYHFGEVLCVRPNPHPTNDDRVSVFFRGLHMEVTRQDARRLATELLGAAEGIRDTPDLAGITAHLEDS